MSKENNNLNISRRKLLGSVGTIGAAGALGGAVHRRYRGPFISVSG